MKVPRIAVIGLNFGKKHALSLKSNEVEGEPAAVVDLNPAFAAFAESIQTPYYSDYKEMMEKEKPDGVIIVVPPNYHMPIGVYCLDHGAHILVEKPVTFTLKDADVLIAAARENGRQVLVGQHHRFDPSVVRAKEKISSRECGPLIGFHIFGTLPKPEWYFKDEYRRMRETGGGTVANNGIHDIDRIRYLCGDIESVCAVKGNAYRGFEVEDTAAVSIKCKNGAVGTYYISDCSHPISEFTDYYFTEKATIRFKCSSFYAQTGSHTYEEGALDEKEFAYPLRERTIKTAQIPLQDNHQAEVSHFCKIITDGIVPITDGEDGKKSLEAMLAIIESLDTGKPVNIK